MLAVLHLSVIDLALLLLGALAAGFAVGYVVGLFRGGRVMERAALRYLPGRVRVPR